MVLQYFATDGICVLRVERGVLHVPKFWPLINIRLIRKPVVPGARCPLMHNPAVLKQEASACPAALL